MNGERWHRPSSTRRARYLFRGRLTNLVATGTIHEEKTSKAMALSNFARSSSRGSLPAQPGVISLRPLKDVVEKLKPDHPLRILLTGEPDEIPCGEYLAKVSGWYRLLQTPSE